jgi:hypothetical protein
MGLTVKVNLSVTIQLFAAASLGGEEFCQGRTVRGELVLSECGEQLPLPMLLIS